MSNNQHYNFFRVRTETLKFPNEGVKILTSIYANAGVQKVHINARLKGINPGHPFSISALVPRKTKLMALYI